MKPSDDHVLLALFSYGRTSGLITGLAWSLRRCWLRAKVVNWSPRVSFDCEQSWTRYSLMTG